MDQPKKKERLTPEEQEKECLMRAGSHVVRKISGKISAAFYKLPEPEDPEGLALRYRLEDRRQSR